MLGVILWIRTKRRLLIVFAVVDCRRIMMGKAAGNKLII